MTGRAPLHLAVALDTVGWHPGAAPTETADLYGLAWWTELAREAERRLLGFVTLEDPTKRPTDTVRHVTDQVVDGAGDHLSVVSEESTAPAVTTLLADRRGRSASARFGGCRYAQWQPTSQYAPYSPAQDAFRDTRGVRGEFAAHAIARATDAAIGGRG